jgi:FADH2 O2-dependent halogenase
MSKLRWGKLSKTFDLAIVGSGFAGSLLATIARSLGHSVVLLEKSKHPRFVIGESATPLANLLIQELASRYDLPSLLPLTKWGSWQRAYPEIGCGLKRGFTFYHHFFGSPFSANSDRSDQLLVAASPHDKIADTHWYRPDFDHFLVREAQHAGVEYLDEVVLDTPVFSKGKVKLRGRRRADPVSIEARFLIDTSGPRGFLHRTLKLREAPFENLPPTQGLYTHFSGVRRLEDIPVFVSGETPPYPIDDAAVHHVFDGGWIWVLRFNNGITSAGVAATSALADELRFAEGAQAWQRLLQRLPSVAEQFSEAEPQFAFVHAPRLSFRSEAIVGERWALLPSAAGFIDPLLSTGFPLTLLGVERIAKAIERDWDSAGFEDRLQVYAAETGNELLAAERLIAALYANMREFDLFTSISLLYFAAASFSEAARRLGRQDLAGSFLLYDHTDFGPQYRSCLQQAMRSPNPAQKAKLVEQIQQAIEPVNVAGLGAAERRNWYPVDANDLMGAAGKLGTTEKGIEQLLQRSGFWLE